MGEGASPLRGFFGFASIRRYPRVAISALPQYAPAKSLQQKPQKMRRIGAIVPDSRIAQAYWPKANSRSRKKIDKKWLEICSVIIG